MIAAFCFICPHYSFLLHNLLPPFTIEMAVNDDALRRNPFKFPLSDIIPADADQRTALSKNEMESFLGFMKKRGSKYYGEVIILLGTGMRVSELYGLTCSDIDFEHNCIHVRRQLARTSDDPYFVSPPKSKSGIRTIPMSPSVRTAFMTAIKNRKSPEIELNVDGCCGFLFLDKNGNPKVAMHIENHFRTLRKLFLKKYGFEAPIKKR